MNNKIKKIQIPDIFVFGVLLLTVFGISIWLLVFHSENPTNWILYILMAMAVLAGLVRLTLHWRKMRTLFK